MGKSGRGSITATPPEQHVDYGSQTPKKKKKKKKEDQAEDVDSSQPNTSQNTTSSSSTPRKKKKKKKRREEEVNGEVEGREEESPRKRGREEEEEEVEEESPRKKKKKKKRKSPTKEEIKEEIEEEEIEEIGIEEVDMTEWPREATMEILTRVANQIAQKDHNRSCRVTLKGIDWAEVASYGRSAESCKAHFMGIYRKINPFKTLATVVSEMNQLVSRGAHSKPALPIHRFLKEYFTEETKADIRRRGESMLKKGHEAWKNLPAAEKEIYMKSYKDDAAKWNLSNEKSLSSQDPAVKLPKAPYQLCYDSEGKGHTSLSSKSYYASLPPHRQLPYIHQALKDAMTYDSDITEYLTNKGEAGTKQEPNAKQERSAANPNQDKGASPQTIGKVDHQPSKTKPNQANQSKPHALPITKSDFKTYLDAKGCPPMPPVRPFMLFYNERVQDGSLDSIPGPNKLLEATKIYKDLDRKDKKKYKLRLDQIIAKFVADLATWSQEQDGLTLYALKKYRAILPNIGVTKPPTAQKIEDIFPYAQKAAVSCPKFLSEPPRPPATPYRLFAIKYRTTNILTQGHDLQRAIKESWAEFTDEERDMYKERCEKLHQDYKEEITAFVSQLDQKTRKLFLGFSRVPLYKFFGNRDVFEADYPNSEEYPIFTKRNAADSSPVKGALLEGPVDAAVPRKRKLSPVLFSSLEEPPSEDEDGRDRKKHDTLKKNTTTTTAATEKMPETSEEEEDKEEGVHLVQTKNKKKPTTTTTTTTTAVATKKKAELEETETETESEEDTPVPATTSSRKRKNTTSTTTTATKPPTTTTTTTTTSESESEDEIKPVWKSPLVMSKDSKDKATTTPPSAKKKKKKQQKSEEVESKLQKKKQKKKKKQASSSSSSSDSD